MSFVSFSDAGGIGGLGTDDSKGLPNDPTQGALIVLACDRNIENNKCVRTSILAWRSSRLRRKVLSTLAGETQALSSAVAEVEYLQIMHRDAALRDVTIRDHH
eukprot:7417028-Pyramimonas_sp.AAC.1